MESGWMRWGIVLAVCLILFFTNLGGPKLWDRDEPRNAGCAWEMMQAGDWVVPRFNDELRPHKPALTYWLMISAYHLFGVNEFSARFSSATLGVLTVLLTYGIGRRLFSGEVAFWGSLALATSLMFTVASRAATPDAPLIFTVTLAMWVFTRFSFPSESERTSAANQGVPRSYYPTQWWQVALLYATMGLAVLAKGPIGLILPTAIIGMFLLIQRLPVREATGNVWIERMMGICRPFAPLHFLKTVWFMRPILAIVACLAVALPWYLWVASRDFRFVEGFFWEHNFNRATSAFEGHAGPPYYYLLAICVGFFPWSIFFAPLLGDLVTRLRSNRRDPERPAVVFLCCWVVVWLVAFSIAQTKLPSYVTPLYPALALLTGVFAQRCLTYWAYVPSLWRYTPHGVTCVVGLGILIAAPLAAQRYLPGEDWLGLIGLPLLVGGLAALVLAAKKMPLASFGAHAASGVVFSVALFAVGAQRVSDHNQIENLITQVREVKAEPDWHSWAVLESTWVYYAGAPVRFISSGNSQNFAVPTGENVILLTTSWHWDRMAPAKQNEWEEVARSPYFLEQDDLIALQRKPQGTTIATLPESSESGRK
ncbi:MAG: glycosyltransferase family 39 protein [Pirellulaceae bacterium]